MLAPGDNLLGTDVKNSTVTITKFMKPLRIPGVLLAICCVINSARAVDLAKLKVLYVGEPPSSTRAKQVTGFVEKNVAAL